MYRARGDRFLGCGMGPQTAGVRIDVYGSSGDYLASGIDGMEIHVHGNAQDQGETVSIAALAEKQDWLPVPGELPGAGIAYEDRHVIVLCKPHDRHTEPQRPNEAGTLAGHLLQRHPGVAGISPVPRLTLLTRLDYATSGAVPAAMTEESFRFLRHEREMGNIRKSYLCLVEWEIRSPSTIAYVIEAEGRELARHIPEHG